MSARPHLRVVHRTTATTSAAPSGKTGRLEVRRAVLEDLLGDQRVHLDTAAALHLSVSCPALCRLSPTQWGSARSAALLQATLCRTCAPQMAHVCDHRTSALLARADAASLPVDDADLRVEHVATMERLEVLLAERDDSDPQAAAAYQYAATTLETYRRARAPRHPTVALVHPRFDIHRPRLMRDLHLSPLLASSWCPAHHRATLVRLTTPDIAAQVTALQPTSRVECGNQASSVTLPPGWTPTHSALLGAIFSPHRRLEQVIDTVVTAAT